MSHAEHKGFYKQHRLPHLDIANLLQFTTVVIADAAPRSRKPLSIRKKDSDEDFLGMDAVLDHGEGSCPLKNPAAAGIIRDCILESSGELHHPLAWVVMPNHVHLLSAQIEGCRIDEMMRKIKGRSAIQINRLLGLSGSLWQKGYFDRAIRGLDHLAWTLDYIHENPVKAGLVDTAKDWEYSSFRTHEDAVILDLIERESIHFLS